MALLKPWLIAARPATLWASVAPVLVGSGLAIGDGAFRFLPGLAALVGAVAIQVGTNFANDVSDFQRGADNDDRVGPPRAVASGVIAPNVMWRGVWGAFGLATLVGVYLIFTAGWPVAIIGVAAILAGLGYVGGPFPYGYRGLGEVFVFVFFGLVATVGSRYVHDRTAPGDAWLLATAIGFLAAAILVANNIRDLRTDEEAGKRTLAVIMGLERSRRLYAALVIGAFAWIWVFGVLGAVSGWTLLTIALTPLAAPIISTVTTSTDPERLIGALTGTARLHVLFAALLAVGSAF